MTGLRRVNASTWVGLGAWLAVGIVTAFVMRVPWQDRQAVGETLQYH